MSILLPEEAEPGTPATAKAEIYLTVGSPGVLTVKREDGTTASLEAGAGGGETNTASNQGSGTNIFIQKTTFDLEFNGIKSENSRITIAEDAVSNDVEITLVESAIDHDALTNFLAAEHVDWAGAGAGTIHTDNYIEGGAGTDTDAIHDNIASEISAITVKGTPVGADFMVIEDSADSNNKKHMLISGLEAILDHDSLSGFVAAEHVASTAVETMTNKTLTTPTIGDFSNAAHDHEDAAGGAQLSLTAAVTGALPVANGGTALTSGTDGGLLAYTATGTIASSALLVANAIVMGGGAGVVPATLALGTAFQYLRINSGATANEYVTRRESKAFTIETPVNGDRHALWMNEGAITILGVSFSSEAGTSVLFNIEFQTTIASGTVVHTDTCATSTPEWDVTPSGTTAVPTDRILLAEITTVTGSVTQLHVTVHYREND